MGVHPDAQQTKGRGVYMRAKPCAVLAAFALSFSATEAAAVEYADQSRWLLSGACNHYNVQSFSFGDQLLIFLPADTLQVEVPTIFGEKTDQRTCTIGIGFDLQPGDYIPVANQFLSYQIFEKTQFASARFAVDGIINGVPVRAGANFPAGLITNDNTVGTVAAGTTMPIPNPQTASCLGLTDKAAVYLNNFTVSGSVVNNFTDFVRAGLLPGQVMNLSVTISAKGNGPICEHRGGAVY